MFIHKLMHNAFKFRVVFPNITYYKVVIAIGSPVVNLLGSIYSFPSFFLRDSGISGGGGRGSLKYTFTES